MEELEKRVLELESRFSFLDDLLQKLNEVVADQQLQISESDRLNQLLRQRIAELSEQIGEGGNTSSDEKPPHY